MNVNTPEFRRLRPKPKISSLQHKKRMLNSFSYIVVLLLVYSRVSFRSCCMPKKQFSELSLYPGTVIQ